MDSILEDLKPGLSQKKNQSQVANELWVELSFKVSSIEIKISFVFAVAWTFPCWTTWWPREGDR